ncbi:translation protein [Dichotomopilus funicola]|uniref:Large ribosomal subunit protein uL3m n=1 Tax=Dichotomopilus funicola TaxID=1934379 RepID=A0AAN6UV66_9PEZI|nr:translation protein [Dichotomopilus funicola]
MAPRLPAHCWRQLALRPATTTSTPTTTTTTVLSQSSLLRRSPDYSETTPNPTPLSYTQTRTVSSGWSTLPARAKPHRFNQTTSGLPAPTTGPAAALKRKELTTPVRTGVLAIKKGMTVFMGKRGGRIGCTVLQMDRVQTVLNKNRRDHGYWAVQVGMGERLAGNVGAPMLGYYEAKGIAPKERLAEFRVRGKEGLLPIGVQLMPDWFYVGQRVDVRSNSRGQGFAGGMKRHGFSGQGASHGNSKNHRTPGSVGPSQGSGSRVLPGKKMPGRMGNEQVTIQNLPILLVDNDLGLIVVKGCVAGPKGTIVKVQDACKKEPPAQSWIDGTRRVLEERFPHAEAHLQAARERHLELKEARQEKRIEELLKEGVPGPEETAEAIEELLAEYEDEAAARKKIARQKEAKQEVA